MQDSIVQTLTIIPNNPTRLISATTVPMRVVVRVTGTNAFLAFSTNDLSPISSNAFNLPVNQEVVLILAPRQTLYAGNAANFSITFAASEAFPVI